MFLLGNNGTDSTILIKTSNGGLNWSLISKIQGYRYSKVSIANNNTGIMCGNSGLISRTTNQGLTWFSIAPFTAGNINSAVMINDSTGYCACDQGKIFKTTNAGLNWFQQTTTVVANLFKIAVTSGDTGYATGGNGTILKTTNGGLTFVEPVRNNIPEDHILLQNYPNPFNPTTRIRFSIPEASIVKLVIYDVLGKEAAELVNSDLNAGNYSYDFNGEHFASGVYFCRLEVYRAGSKADGFTDIKKMLLIK
jgi:hypothetical protein